MENVNATFFINPPRPRQKNVQPDFQYRIMHKNYHVPLLMLTCLTEWLNILAPFINNGKLPSYQMCTHSFLEREKYVIRLEFVYIVYALFVLDFILPENFLDYEKIDVRI